ncbi:2-hydroxyacid dehydrogenase [Labrys monachus]|uniref:Lactate dehydrogenase-like 2-hydroxyacid dehydrogenase n=1 Tax=Labrys monachus TaxID=217067 RepID=A0ABU0F8L4_9HYPH|nr:2-hydroxyacid dehydrogenase [Labrys monachus]MDQ0390781.1 lactate dehydrogenase-like 2-hydroxyacid dehydrogenase [Labrys monachus]
MPRPLLPQTIAALEREFTVHKLWEAKDPDAAMAQIAGLVRFIAAGAHAPVDEALIKALPKLELVANFGVGYDSVDAAAAARHGVVVTNTPDVLNEEVADVALGLLIATAREFPQADRYLREGKWLKSAYPLTRGTLRGRTLGIVGLGRIGKAIAKRAEAFGLKIAYHSRRRQADSPYAYYPTLLELAEAVDTLMLIVPGGAETRNMVNAEVLKALGPNGILINMARGTVVDEAALAEALASGQILAAGLDVFADEPNVPASLIGLANTVLLPHIGSASVHTREAMGQLLIDNLVSWRDGKGPLTPVPETPWPRA